MNNRYLNEGYMLGIQTSVSLGIDTSASAYQDYQLSSFNVYNYSIYYYYGVRGFVTPINGGVSNKLMVRVAFKKESVISTFRQYTSSNTYKITATLSSTKIPGTLKNVSQNILIQQGINNLAITTPPFCEINVPCTLSSSVATGSSVSIYYWYLIK